MNLLTKDQLRAIHAKTKLAPNKIIKLDEIWLRLDPPQRSIALDNIGYKTKGIQQEARLPLDRLDSVMIKKLAKYYVNRLSEVTDDDFAEMKRKSALHFLGHKVDFGEELQSDRTLMSKIYTERRKDGKDISREEMLREMDSHGVPKQRAIDLLSKARVRPDGMLDFSLGWYQSSGRGSLT